MQFNMRNIIIGCIILLLVIIIIINKDAILPGKKKNLQVLSPVTPDGKTVGEQNGPVRRGITSDSLNSYVVLHQGDRGPEVVELQHILNQVDKSANLVEDGLFGPLTVAALKKNTGVSSITLQQLWKTFVQGYQTEQEKSKSNLSFFGVKF